MAILRPRCFSKLFSFRKFYRQQVLQSGGWLVIIKSIVIVAMPNLQSCSNLESRVWKVFASSILFQAHKELIIRFQPYHSPNIILISLQGPKCSPRCVCGYNRPDLMTLSRLPIGQRGVDELHVRLSALCIHSSNNLHQPLNLSSVSPVSLVSYRNY